VNFQEDIVNAIRQAMPPDAKIQVVNGIEGFTVGVSWKLNDDPERPNKMSKTISIVVSDEAAQDVASASSHNQTEVYNRVNTFLSQKFANFDPSHNVPKYDPPPVEQWVLSSNVLFG